MPVVPPNISDLAAKRIVIAWKNEREARRAVMDALPLLVTAEEVHCRGSDWGSGRRPFGFLKAICGGMRSRRVAYNSVLQTESISDEIIAVAHRKEADLIVAGAYGRSRMRERLRGVTLAAPIMRQYVVFSRIDLLPKPHRPIASRATGLSEPGEWGTGLVEHSTVVPPSTHSRGRE